MHAASSAPVTYLPYDTVDRSSAHADSLGVPLLAVRAILNAVPPNIPRSAFVDYGCGVGRVLVAARHAGFDRVIGVEPAEALVAVGRRSLRGYSGCEIVHSDAANFDVPDDATVFFFGNPFVGIRLAKVLLHVQRSIERRPRRHLILGYFDVDRIAATARRAELPMRRVIQGYHKPADRSWAGWVFDIQGSAAQAREQLSM
jgi:SAM-dependent methyltransferase